MSSLSAPSLSSSSNIIPLVKNNSNELLRSHYSSLLFNKTWEELSKLQQSIITHSWVATHPEHLTPSEVVSLNSNAIEIDTFAAKILKRRLSKKKDWVFMTINPRPGTKLEQLKNALENRFEVSVHVGDFMYCYETRKDFQVEDPGLHVHILFRKHEAPSKCIPQIENIFKAFVETPLHIKTIIVGHSEVPRIKQYIRGYKQNKLKKNHAHDQDYRHFHSLLDVYGTII